MRWLASMLLVLLSCALPAQIDWNYIDQSNEKALKEFIVDHKTAAKFQAPENKGCMHSWSSGKYGYNCTNYGIAMWVLYEAHRLRNSNPELSREAYEWLADHARHMTEYGYYWKGLHPTRSHRAGGEGVKSHPVWKQEQNDDGDKLRHIHLAPYCAIYACPYVPLKPEERAKLREMIIDWADNWYLKIDWFALRDKGILFQYGRGMVPALGLIGTFYITGDRKYLRAAQYIFACTYWGLERKIDRGYQKEPFWAYDTGYEAEKRTRKLLYFSAHFNMEPWQIAFTAEVAFHLHYWTNDPNIRTLIHQVMLRVTEWVVRPDIPKGDLNGPGDRDMTVRFLQGGSLFDIYRFQMTPEEALNIAEDKSFYPLVVLHAHLWDGQYWNRFLPNLLMRWHYPRKNGGQPVGPVCGHPTMYNWADMLLIRYFLTGKKEDLQWAQWIYRDSKYFANRSSISDSRTLLKRDKHHYGSGNIGKTRGFSWWARGSLMARVFLSALRNKK